MNLTEVSETLTAIGRFTRDVMRKAAKSKEITDRQIEDCKALLATWKPNMQVETDECLRYQDKVYRARQAHTTQEDWEPDKTTALWAVIDVVHSGTIDDPIPASRGMDYVNGKWYKDPDDYKKYICQWQGSSEGDVINLQYLPHELYGQYFFDQAQ